MYSTMLPATARHIEEMLASASSRTPGPEEITRLLAKERLELSDVADLVSCHPNSRPLVSAAASARRIEHWNGAVYPIAPLYVSDFCVDNCGYCAFRRDNHHVQRNRLSADMLRKNVIHLAELGYRAIELVAGTDTRLQGGRAAEYVAIAKDALAKYDGGRLGVNFAPCTTSEYRLLVDAGLDFIVLWQESYHEATYRRHHADSPVKRDMYFRLDAFDRMLEAGIRKVGMAFLGGLYDWRFEVLALVAHGRYLESVYDVSPYLLGTPRLKPAAGADEGFKFRMYDDEEWSLAANVLKLVFPTSLLWLSTREDIGTNLNVCAGGGEAFTLDCSTAVGGYLDKAASLSQFPVYSYGYNFGVNALTRNGLRVESCLP